MVTPCLYLRTNSLLAALWPRFHLVKWKLIPSSFHGDALPELAPGGTSRRRKKRRLVVVSSVHSNPKILKTNRRTPFGQTLSPYDDDDDDEGIGEDYDEEEEEDENDSSGEESDLSDSETTYGRRSSFSSGIQGNKKQGTWAMSRKIRQEKGFKKVEKELNIEEEKFTQSRFRKLSEDLEFDEKWFPLIDYLSTFGLKESHFIQIYERHMPCLQINVASAQERLEFLLSVGVKQRDIRKILLRQPQILEYTVENNLKAHVSFLISIGIPDSRVGQIISAAPSLLSYSVEQSLKPTIRYLIEEVGIKTSDVSKVVQLSPQILVQRLDNSWTTRFGFLSKELGAPKDSIVKMVTKHPQLLHYSIEDGILPRINFLRSIGMRNSDILKILTSLTQVLSLSLEDNLKPKYLYLVNELRNEAKSLTKYPTYLSLSLEQRIRPRHRFLVALKKAPKGPFPLSSFVPTDECFCQQWAGTSLDKYLAFRQSFLLSQFAKKYKNE